MLAERPFSVIWPSLRVYVETDDDSDIAAGIATTTAILRQELRRILPRPAKKTYHNLMDERTAFRSYKAHRKACDK